MNTYKVLSIDAWGNQEDGYEWNQWFDVGNIEIDINAGEPIILQAMVDAGYITQTEGAMIDDDQYNLVICDNKTNEPLFAIEYGNTI
jgi:hypothetical protein